MTVSPDLARVVGTELLSLKDPFVSVIKTQGSKSKRRMSHDLDCIDNLICHEGSAIEDYFGAAWLQWEP